MSFFRVIRAHLTTFFILVKVLVYFDIVADVVVTVCQSTQYLYKQAKFVKALVYYNIVVDVAVTVDVVGVFVEAAAE